MTKGNNWLCFLVITAVLGWEGDDVSLRLAKEALHRMGIDPNRPFSRDTAMNSFVFVQHVFNQIQEKQNDLRISPDRDPRVQFYNSLSENSNGRMDFDLYQCPIVGNVTKVEVAFTGHLHRNFTIEIASPSQPDTVVTTARTPHGKVADITTLVADKLSDSTLTLFISVKGAGNWIRHLSPVVAIFLDLDVSVLNRRRKRFVVQTGNSSVSADTTESTNYCRLKPWTVSLRDLNWYPLFIYSPESYQANLCSGECPGAILENYFNSTNYATVKLLSEKSLCCTPIEYSDQSLIFFTNNTPVVKIAKDMSVRSCGCR